MSFSLCKDGLREWIFLVNDWRINAESLINKGFQRLSLGFKSRRLNQKDSEICLTQVSLLFLHFWVFLSPFLIILIKF